MYSNFIIIIIMVVLVIISILYAEIDRSHKEIRRLEELELRLKTELRLYNSN